MRSSGLRRVLAPRFSGGVLLPSPLSQAFESLRGDAQARGSHQGSPLACSPPGQGESFLAGASRNFGSWTNPLDDSEEEEKRLRAIEQAFAEYRQLEAAPAWLPLLPGGGYWIPPQPSRPDMPSLTPPSVASLEVAETPEHAATEPSAAEEPTTVMVTIKTLRNGQVGEENPEKLAQKSVSGTSGESHRHRFSSNEAALASPASMDSRDGQNHPGAVLPEASGQGTSTADSASEAEQAGTGTSSLDAGVDVVLEFSLPDSPGDDNITTLLLGETHFPAWNTVLTQMRLAGNVQMPCGSMASIFHSY